MDEVKLACNQLMKQSEAVYLQYRQMLTRVREKKGAEPLPEKDKRTAEEFIKKYHKNIIQKWVKFFVLKQSVRSTRINKKL